MEWPHEIVDFHAHQAAEKFLKALGSDRQRDGVGSEMT